MTDNEQTIREKLAACHHIIHYMGCDDLLATHLAARIPQTETLLITPYNIPFEEISASKLVKCDLNGNIISENGYKTMPQAVNIHASIYRKYPAIMSSMHTHSIYGTAVASLECGFLFSNQHALRFYNDIAYHELDGLALDNEGEHIANSLGDKKVMILRNHGLLTGGRSVEEALYRIFYLERLCEMQIKTMTTGATIKSIPEDVRIKTKKQYDSILTPHLEFEALTRRYGNLSRIDYRE